MFQPEETFSLVSYDVKYSEGRFDLWRQTPGEVGVMLLPSPAPAHIAHLQRQSWHVAGDYCSV